jgi:tRNA threonylcarbamoyladenosine biosynthesis protein TsaE
MIGVFVIRTPGPEATERVGRALAAEVQPGDCIELQGDLGAGKTCLVRGLAEGLGCDASQVSSPTFTLMHRYPGSLADLVHIDAYRLHGHEELRDAGFDPDDPRAVTAVEWPARAAGALPARSIRVRIEVLADTERQIQVEVAAGTLAERLAGGLGPKPCPGCRTPVGPFAELWPFCSPRCRSADLGRWLSGHYQISRPLEERDLDEG